MSNYDDIINLPHHVSLNHKHMPIADRAAQFAPFAALNGYEQAISETARATKSKREISDDQKAMIDAKLQIILNDLDSCPNIQIIYFEQDKIKSGGEYLIYNGTIKGIDECNKKIILSNNQKIDLDEIIDIKSVIFDSYFFID